MNNITQKLLVLSTAVLIFGSGYKLGQMNAKNQTPQFKVTNLEKNNTAGLDFSLFWEAWNEVSRRYVDDTKIDAQKMYYGAIKGMVASLEDPYTFFLTPEENQQSKDDLSGKFEGIGAQLGLKGGQIVIIAPLKKSPAERAGIKSGDIVVKVNGKSTQGWTLQKAVSEIRGEKGTSVTITVLRDDKEVNKKIQRDQINVPSVELTVEDSVAVLTLTRFGEQTNDEWDKAVRQIGQQYEQEKIRGMVLDLRDNPGGYLQGAVYTASEFLPRGRMVVKQQYADKSAQDYTVNRQGQLLTIPLVVLINEGSASASEIVAGALRDHKRAQLVGQKTFGKGSVQEALDLSKGAGIHITIAKWILPAGDWINGTGITPRISVKNELEEGNTLTRKTDAQLDKAISSLIKESP